MPTAEIGLSSTMAATNDPSPLNSSTCRTSWNSPARYRRIGIVEARRATEEEVVESREGDGTAKPGDWVVRGSEGEQWPVSAEKFRIGYEGPVD